MSKTAYMVMGRWQPLHKGHITLINKAYNKWMDNLTLLSPLAPTFFDIFQFDFYTLLDS